MQTKAQSLLESAANVASGAVLSWALTYWVLPLWGHAYSAAQAWQITVLYTAVSFIRSYAWRRWFNRRASSLLPATPQIWIAGGCCDD